MQRIDKRFDEKYQADSSFELLATLSRSGLKHNHCQDRIIAFDVLSPRHF